MTNADHTLSIAAEIANLPIVRDFVCGSAASLGAAPRIVPHFVLAIEEAATNVIEHGYGGQPGTIDIEIFRDGPDVVMRLRDLAPAFDPLRQVGPPDLVSPLGERDPGRLGVYLIRQFMDEVSYRPRAGGGNELTMRKRVA